MGLQKIKTNLGEIYFTNFEEIVSRSEVIAYNDESIELADGLIFWKDKELGFLEKVINIGAQIIKIEPTTFDNMIKAIEASASDPNILMIESETKPKRNVLINLNQLKDNFVSGRKDENVLSINNYIFTNSKAEFHGLGAFLGKKAFYVSFEDMSKIIKYVLPEESVTKTVEQK